MEVVSDGSGSTLRLPLKWDPATYCIACRKCLNFQCDILGVITLEVQVKCWQGGYRETKPTPITTVRHYEWKKGAL